MDTSLDHFDEEDLKLIEDLKKDDESAEGANTGNDASTTQQAAASQGGSSEQGGANASGQGTQANDNQSAQGQGDQGGQQDQQQGIDGNVKAALRASRQAERRLKTQLANAQQQLEELRSKLPADTNTDDIAALEADFPQVAAAMRKQSDELERLRSQVGSRAAGDDTSAQGQGFTPPALPLEVQEVVDEIPDLLALQHNPDQTGWQLAVGFDATLRNHPVWGAKTDAERFAEAARRAKAELGGQQQQQQSTTQLTPEEEARRKAEAKANAAQRRNPESLSDFGGAATEPQASNLARYSRMSDEDITAELLRGG